jgi:peptide/nickel transport system substrate-binding protein
MRTYKLISVLMLLAIVLAACGTPATPAATEAPTTAPTEVVKVEPTKAPTEAPTTAPTEAPTAAPSATLQPLPEGVTNILTVKLRQGLKWSDGTDLTAKDLVGTYNIYWLQALSVWTLLKDVVAVDDHTVDFQISNPSPRVQRLVLRSYQPAPYSQYGKWMDAAGKLRADGKAADSEEAKALLDDLYAFKPDTIVAYGPFIIDPASVTEAQLELPKNPTGYNADKIDIQKILVYYGETAVSLPLVLSNDVDYSTHGYTPSDVEAIKAIPNLKILSSPTGTGPGLWFNNKFPPLDKKEVRQAFAYIIDRAENAKVAMGEAGLGIDYEIGFTNLQMDTWITPETKAKLNPYKVDLAKAEELLKSVGFTKNANGKWLDDKGKPFAVELSVPADFADWLGSAENAAQQLSAFGINATVRGYPSSERATTQKEGKYQILVDLSIYYNPPHPWSAYNYYLNPPRNAPEATDNLFGMAFPWKQTVEGKEINIPDVIKEAFAGFDFEAQKPAINTLALMVNEQLPVLAMFERISTDVVNFDTRISGWRDFSDPIYKNNQSDLYIAIQLLNGELKVSPTGDGSFHTVYPYPQPPNYDLNFFTTTSLPQGVGNPSYNLMFPPLFYYMWADAKYVPAVAESFTLR